MTKEIRQQIWDLEEKYPGFEEFYDMVKVGMNQTWRGNALEPYEWWSLDDLLEEFLNESDPESVGLECDAGM